jgi:capsular polysaccharide biosynthesis protein
MMAKVSLDTVDSAPSTFKIISYALPPGKPVWPKKKLLMLVAVLMGLLGGVAIGLFLDMISNIATRDRLAERQDLPVFGTINLETPRRTLLPRGGGGSGSNTRRRAIDHLKSG